MRLVPWICAAAASTSLLAGAHAEGVGLSTSAERVPWARFDARVTTVGASTWRTDLAPFERSGLKVAGVGFLGDVYFTAAPADASTSSSRGFRATSGLIVSARPAYGATSSAGLLGSERRNLGASSSIVDASAENTTLPYLGIGYSNSWPKSGWRVSADLGLVSLSPGGATGIGRVIGGSQSLDDLVRDLRLAPVVQLGVSYSF